MKKVLLYLKTIGIFFAAMLGFAMITSCLQLLGLSSSVTKITNMLFVLLYFFGTGFVYGRRATSKGFLEGFKIGLLLIFFLFLFSFLGFRSTFSLAKMIYYIVLLLASVFGSMIGINHTKEKK